MPVQATEASGVLAIPNVRPEDTGTYICTGSDLTSVAQDRATLLVEGILKYLTFGCSICCISVFLILISL